MIEPGFVALVLADAPTAALIADRIFPLILPENGLKPALTYRLVSTVPQYGLDGPMDPTMVRLQLDSWGDTYADAKALASALQTLLDDFAGVLPNGVVVACISRDDEGAGFDTAERSYYVRTDWMIQYSEQ